MRLADMIQPGIVQNAEKRIDCPGLRIGCTVNDPRNTCLHDRTGTHRAWFERNVKRAFFQSPALHGRSRLRDGDHLGVCRRILELLSLIVRPGNDLAAVNDDGTDRNFILTLCVPGLSDRLAHEMFVDQVFVDFDRIHANAVKK